MRKARGTTCSIKNKGPVCLILALILLFGAIPGTAFANGVPDDGMTEVPEAAPEPAADPESELDPESAPEPESPAEETEAAAADPDTGGISGMVWLDENGDGVMDEAEPPLSGAELRLYPSGDMDNIIAAGQTDESGIYAFTNIKPGEYVVRVEATDEYIPPDSDAGNDNMLLGTGYTEEIAIAANSNIKDINIGMLPDGIGIFALMPVDVSSCVVYTSADLVSALQDPSYTTIYFGANIALDQRVTVAQRTSLTICGMNPLEPEQSTPYTYTYYCGDSDDNDRDCVSVAVTPVWLTSNITFKQIDLLGYNMKAVKIASALYALEYDGNGADSGEAPAGGFYDPNAAVTIADAGDLALAGYTFAGWNTEQSGGGTPYSPDDIFQITEDMTLYAQWTRNTYTVSGALSGGSVSGLTVSCTIDGGATQTVATDSEGNYAITAVPHGSELVITPPEQENYAVSPGYITLSRVTGNSTDNNFTYTVYRVTENYVNYGGDVVFANATSAALVDGEYSRPVSDLAIEGYNLLGYCVGAYYWPDYVIWLAEGETEITFTDITSVYFIYESFLIDVTNNGGTPDGAYYGYTVDRVAGNMVTFDTNANRTVFAGTGYAYTISGTSTSLRITVPSGVNTDIILSTLNIQNMFSPFRLLGSAVVNMTLSGTSILKCTGYSINAGYYQAGLYVDSAAKLSIDGGASDSLNAQGGINGAGIGGSFLIVGFDNINGSGPITINGGMVYATGGGIGVSMSGGAGIGGGHCGSGGTITINGGAVYATGGTGANSGAAGIGGGNNGGSGTITINGGTVEARGADINGGAGIGSGQSDQSSGDGIITIKGGDVVATGGGNAAGIGSGNASSASAIEITISGGTVKATAGDAAAGSFSGAGIGGGSMSNGGTITINGGMIEATGSAAGFSGGAGIGGGGLGNSGTITISGGAIKATGGAGALYGGAGIGGGGAAYANTISISGGTITATGASGARDIGHGTTANTVSGSIVFTGGSILPTRGSGTAYVFPNPTNGIENGNNEVTMKTFTGYSAGESFSATAYGTARTYIYNAVAHAGAVYTWVYKLEYTVTENYVNEDGTAIREQSLHLFYDVPYTYSFAGSLDNMEIESDVYAYKGYKKDSYSQTNTLIEGRPAIDDLTGDTAVYLVYHKVNSIIAVTIPTGYDWDFYVDQNTYPNVETGATNRSGVCYKFQNNSDRPVSVDLTKVQISTPAGLTLVADASLPALAGTSSYSLELIAAGSPILPANSINGFGDNTVTGITETIYASGIMRLGALDGRYVQQATPTSTNGYVTIGGYYAGYLTTAVKTPQLTFTFTFSLIS